jgi:hypothetical protein
MRATRTITVVAAALACLTAATSFAQQRVRIRGSIEQVEGSRLLIRTRDGALLNVTLADNPRATAMVKAQLSDIKVGSYIGVTAAPDQNGRQRAIAIHIFPEAARGTAEGHSAWDLRPGSTMTNAAVDRIVIEKDDELLTLKYKDGEQKMIVPADTPIVAFAPAEPGEIKPGAQIMIFSAVKQPDGRLQADRINIGRGLVPPM